jgi:FkbH-like protein
MPWRCVLSGRRPELPDDPAFYAALLAADISKPSTTNDDQLRATQYQANARRATLRSTTTDIDGYLRSLEMEAVFAPFDDVGRTRVTQLINKTNQFNLTTRRYSEPQVEAFEKSNAGLTLQVRRKSVQWQVYGRIVAGRR